MVTMVGSWPKVLIHIPFIERECWLRISTNQFTYVPTTGRKLMTHTVS